MGIRCDHVDQIREVKPKTPGGCEECLRSGDTWVQLRLCAICGHVGCCDSSNGKHATGHFRSSGHPIMRSYEAGANWGWCYVDEMMLEPFPLQRPTAQ